MLDHIIPKPFAIEAYAGHRIVAELCSGYRYQFVDMGNYFVVRTDKEITATGRVIKLPVQDEIIAFTLRTSVASRHKNQNIYPATGDWRVRRAWLEKQGEKFGFLVQAVHVTSRHLKIKDKDSRTFTIDCTDFTGVLKVTEEILIETAIKNGIGRVGKAFGMGMLVI
jgi:hypothetical protein